MENAIKTIKMNTIDAVMNNYDTLTTIKDELECITDDETTLDILEYIISKVAPEN